MKIGAGVDETNGIHEPLLREEDVGLSPRELKGGVAQRPSVMRSSN